MEVILTTLKPILEDTKSIFGIRELARLTKINHTTVRKRLIEYEKEGYIEKKSLKNISGYSASGSEKFKLLKKYYNLEKIRQSSLIDFLNKKYDYPTIVIFGSYALGEDILTSDIDICIISNVDKQTDLNKYSKFLNKKIQLHLFTKEKWNKLISKKHEIVESIINGNVLSGYLEVFE
jgi:predicted nucleotidyltransferase